MKKSLIALAALAVVGVASAQSSVTLYGVADVAVGRLDVLPGSLGLAGKGLGLKNDNFQVIGSNLLNNGNSRFGLRGVEDLGGGLKAGFNFESGLNLQDGNGANVPAGTTGLTFGRTASVSLMTNMGTLSLGRQYSTAFNSVASWELTNMANYSAVVNQFGFGGVPDPRNSDAIKFNSANYSGLSVEATYVPKGNVVNGGYMLVPDTNFTNKLGAVMAFDKGATDPKDKFDVAVTYAHGPITASLDYNKVMSGNEALVVGGKYDLGTVQVAASYNNYQTTDGTILARGYTVGASAGVGPVTLTADYARDTQFEDSDFVLEAKYALSKRTFIYYAFFLDGGRNVSADAYAFSNGVAPVSGLMGHQNTEDVKGYTLGIRHNF